MQEETGLVVEPGRLLGRVQRPGLGGSVIDIRDYAATVIGGTLRPGDDAADARWADAAELAALAVTEGLLEALTEWGVLGPEQQLSSLFSICMLSALFVPPSDPSRFFIRCRVAQHRSCVTEHRSCVTEERDNRRVARKGAYIIRHRCTAPVSANRSYRMATGPERVTIRLARPPGHRGRGATAARRQRQRPFPPCRQKPRPLPPWSPSLEPAPLNRAWLARRGRPHGPWLRSTPPSCGRPRRSSRRRA